jgi:hypothetical protein
VLSGSVRTTRMRAPGAAPAAIPGDPAKNAAVSVPSMPAGAACGLKM